MKTAVAGQPSRVAMLPAQRLLAENSTFHRWSYDLQVANESVVLGKNSSYITILHVLFVVVPISYVLYVNIVGG